MDSRADSASSSDIHAAAVFFHAGGGQFCLRFFGRGLPSDDELGFPKIVVTQGYLGAVGFNGTFTNQPARADKVVDTMGAGDAWRVAEAMTKKLNAAQSDKI